MCKRIDLALRLPAKHIPFCTPRNGKNTNKSFKQRYALIENETLHQQEKSIFLLLMLSLLWCTPNIALAALSRSLVLLSDIPDNFRFIFTSFISWRILRSIRLGRLRGYDYGTDKVQVFGGLICSAIYIAALLLIAGFTITRIVKPTPMDDTFSAVGAAFQFVLFIVMGWFWYKSKTLAREQCSPVMEMQWRANRADALYSLVCFVSLMLWLVLKKWSWAVYIDPIMALVFMFYAMASFIPTMVSGTNDMLDKTLQEELQLKIDRRLAENFNDYEGFHGVRSRRSGGRIFIEVSLSFAPERQIREVSRTVTKLCKGIQQEIPGSEVRIVLEPCLINESAPA
jgi:cation diffusion facilitator family transporter